MLSPTAKTGNPFNFRAPVRHLRLLAGREEELQQVDEFLRDAAIGKPCHFSLFGEPGMGKSSLLSGVAEIGRQRHLLPIAVTLRDSVVESSLAFYGNIFNAALESLIGAGLLEKSGPLMRAWIEQTLGADPRIDFDRQPLEIGVLLSAQMNGKVVGEVPAAVLRRDFETILSLAGEKYERGLVLCLDNAEALDDNEDLAPGLMEVTEAFPRLVLVTAATRAGKLQSSAPRSWAQIEIGSFGNAWAVFNAIVKPLAETTELALAPKIETAREIYSLTSGRPYEVNLVSHFIWEAISRGEQSEFVLSETVLEQVMHELEERGRHEASPAISRIRQLTTQDLELAGRFVPYEGLTTRQLALLRLMLEPFDEEQLAEAKDAIAVELGRLSALGIISVHGDRFEFIGGPDARLYLRYALERRAGKKVEYGDTYARKAMSVCRRLLSDRLFGSDNLDSLLMGRWMRRELVDAGGGGDWLRYVANAVESENLSALADLFPEFEESEALAKFSENGGVLFGFVLQVGLQSVEYADIGINFDGLTTDEARGRVEAWLAEHRDLLAEYEIVVHEWSAVQIPPPLGKAAAAYSELWRHCHWAYHVFKAGAVGDAMTGLRDAIDRAEALIGDEPTDPLLRAKLADSLNRIGFMQAASAEFPQAKETLESSKRLAVSEEWLTDFNLAYVLASSGDLVGAKSCADSAMEHLAPMEGGEMVLHAWFPTPDDWRCDEPMYATAVIPSGWVERFVKVQAEVLAAAADTDRLDQLRETLDSLMLSSPPGLLRLAGWAEYSILKRTDRAREFFDRAVHSTDLADVDPVTSELEFVSSTRTPKPDESRSEGQSEERSTEDKAGSSA